MRLRTMFSFLAGFLGAAFAQERPWVLMTVSGEVQARGANELDWVRAESGRVLHERETLRCGKAATAQIKTAGDKVFILPENAQIEIRELRPFNREQVVLELTALEMQKLPAKKDSTKRQSNAFILHGALPDSAGKQDDPGTLEYMRCEERGALALFAQGYFAGFILKWNRLANLFPACASEPAEAALIKAYQIMGMPFRMQQAQQRFRQRWAKP
ncbi:MAG: hypothetical protein ACREOI_11490 [bacterium]